MKLDIRGRQMQVTPAMRRHTERRLRFALGRFGTRLDRVTVRLFDVNGPRGGTDKWCRISVGLPATATVVVEDGDSDLYAAIDRAAERVGRMVGRRVQRRRTLAIDRRGRRGSDGTVEPPVLRESDAINHSGGR